MTHTPIQNLAHAVAAFNGDKTSYLYEAAKAVVEARELKRRISWMDIVSDEELDAFIEQFEERDIVSIHTRIHTDGRELYRVWFWEERPAP